MWNYVTSLADLFPPEFTGILSSSFLSCFEPFSVHSLGSSLCSFCSKTKSFHVKTSTLFVTGHFYTFARLPCYGIQIFSFSYILNTTRKNISLGISLLPPFSFQGSRDLQLLLHLKKSLSIPPLPPSPSKAANLSGEYKFSSQGSRQVCLECGWLKKAKDKEGVNTWKAGSHIHKQDCWEHFLPCKCLGMREEMIHFPSGPIVMFAVVDVALTRVTAETL